MSRVRLAWRDILLYYDYGYGGRFLTLHEHYNKLASPHLTPQQEITPYSVWIYVLWILHAPAQHARGARSQDHSHSLSLAQQCVGLSPTSAAAAAGCRPLPHQCEGRGVRRHVRLGKDSVLQTYMCTATGERARGGLRMAAPCSARLGLVARHLAIPAIPLSDRIGRLPLSRGSEVARAEDLLVKLHLERFARPRRHGLAVGADVPPVHPRVEGRLHHRQLRRAHAGRRLLRGPGSNWHSNWGSKWVARGGDFG